MNIHPPLQSATIYQFPIGGRAGLNASREIVRTPAETPRASALALTDAWYHQVAIEQEAADTARPTGKR